MKKSIICILFLTISASIYSQKNPCYVDAVLTNLTMDSNSDCSVTTITVEVCNSNPGRLNCESIPGKVGIWAIPCPSTIEYFELNYLTLPPNFCITRTFTLTNQICGEHHATATIDGSGFYLDVAEGDICY